MKKQEKQQTLVALKVAYENTLKDQEIYCGRIADMEKKGIMDCSKKLPAMGWDGIAKAMANECSPATNTDREKLLKQNSDETPIEIQLAKIEDFDIRARTYFLNEVVEHAQRIKAIAKFLEVLGSSPNNPHANMLYGFWVLHEKYQQFSEEQLEAGNKKKAKSMSECAHAYAGAFDLFAKDPEMPDKLDLNK